MQHLKVLLWILMAELATTATVDSFIFTNGFTGNKLILNGLASITENGVLRLTNDTKQSTGHAIYPTPFHFLQPSTGKAMSFSTTFVFAMIPNDPVYYGYGMTFFISPTTNFSMAMAREFLGLFNFSDNGDSSNHVVAVELDTIMNVEYDDIDPNHLGIDINSVKSNLSHHAGYFDDRTGEFHNLSLVSGELMQVWVDYDGGEMKLNVTLSPIQIPKPKRPLLSLVVNLSSILFNSMYVGLSSSTGILVASDHYVLGWSFKLNGQVPEALNISTLPQHAAIKEKSKYLITIWLPVGSVVLLISMVVAVILTMVRRRKIKFAELVEDWEIQYVSHRFSYKTLFKATKGFNDKQLLGAGGFGKVYKGVLPKSNSEVALKRISHESTQGIREFIAEIVTLGRLRHRNLVQLLGYCWRKGELLLVYNYMPNGSLATFLHCKDYKPALNWSQRLHIIKGVASGLEYLHEDCEQVVIHRDIKTNNVLLDSELNGRLGDFGLARLYDHDMDPQTTQVAGTMGYIAPELARIGRPTTMTDVFAFGVFVLEVACGRRPLDFKLKDDNQIVLVDWVLENWKKGAILDSIDQGLGDEYNVDEMKLALELGLLCSHPLPTSRPSMKQVVQCLNGDALLMPPVSLAFSNFNLLALQPNEGFDKYVVSYPSSNIPSFESNIADLRCIMSTEE